jgi:hypothetical protein
MLNLTTLKKKERKMDTQIVSVSILVITLLNLGLVMIALARLNGLRRDLRTPVVKKFNADFKRKSVDIPKAPENFGKSQHDKTRSRVGNQQPLAQNRPKNNSQQNRPMQIRRPAVKAPDVFSNEASAAPSPIPPRPVATEQALAEGRRPLPPRYNAVANATAPVSFGTAPAELAPMAPAPVSPMANDNGEGAGMEFDRSKMAHGRRNVVAKPVIEDEGAEA